MYAFYLCLTSVVYPQVVCFIPTSIHLPQYKSVHLGNAFVSLSAVQSLRDNRKLSMSEEASAWLDEAVAAADPRVSPWKCPLVVFRSLYSINAKDATVELDIGVYLSRLAFYLIADNSTKRLLDPLLAQEGERNETERKETVEMFTNSAEHEEEDGEKDPFSIASILQRQESLGYAAAPTVAGLKMEMK